MNLELSQNRFKQMKKRSEKRSALFLKKISKPDETLIITITGHLHVESLLNDLLLNFVKKKMSLSFVEKVTLAENLSIINNPEIYTLLLELNNIRNKFSHNLKYRITKKDIPFFVKLIKAKHSKNLNLKKILLGGIFYIDGYLTFSLDFSKHYPFAFDLLHKQDTYKKDNLFKSMKKEIQQNLKELNLEDWKK